MEIEIEVEIEVEVEVEVIEVEVIEVEIDLNVIKMLTPCCKNIVMFGTNQSLNKKGVSTGKSSKKFSHPHIHETLKRCKTCCYRISGEASEAA